MEWVRRHRGKVALGGGVLGGLYLLGRLAERQVVAARWVWGVVCGVWCGVVRCHHDWWCGAVVHLDQVTWCPGRRRAPHSWNGGVWCNAMWCIVPGSRKLKLPASHP